MKKYINNSDEVDMKKRAAPPKLGEKDCSFFLYL